MPVVLYMALLKVNADTLTGSLHYATQSVATGTMVYKHDAFRRDYSAERENLTMPSFRAIDVPHSKR